MTIQFERRTDRPDAAGRCAIHLRAYFDGQRLRFSERIKTGQARSVKKPERPTIDSATVYELRQFRSQGLSFKKIQVATRAPVATMHKYLVT